MDTRTVAIIGGVVGVMIVVLVGILIIRPGQLPKPKPPRLWSVKLTGKAPPPVEVDTLRETMHKHDGNSPPDHQYPRDTKVCPQCGALSMSYARCPNCGHRF